MPLQESTLQLLQVLRRSRQQPRVSIPHLEALLHDAARLGHAAFLQQAGAVLAPPARKTAKAKAPKDPTIETLEQLQRRTGLGRRAFVDLVVRGLMNERETESAPTRERSFPKLVRFYAERVPAGALLEAAQRVAERHSQVY